MDHSANDNSESTIILIVGQERRTFEISEDLICSQCPFSYNAFSGSFLEAQTKVLTFLEDEVHRFEELTEWLSGSSIPNKDLNLLSLSTLWLFADKYHIEKLQIDIMDSLYAKYAEHEEGINISYETLDFIAEQTAQNPSSPLRRIFADMFANGTSLQ